jgi:hypothetical protein
MTDPMMGLAATEEFFSIAVCKKWLDRQPEMEPPRTNYGVLRISPPEPDLIVSEEERVGRVKMLRDLAQVIRETAKAKCVGRPNAPQPFKQEHNPAMMMEALANLEEMNKPGEGMGHD